MKNTGTILVVDDSLESLRMMVEILQSEGFQARPANSGALALGATASWLPDLVLLDMRMPGMDGLEVCRRLKADERTRDIPVIFLSAEADQKERIEGLALGAVDFITKPFQREELLARIDTHLELWHLRTHLAETVAQKVEELQKRNADLERFTYTVSHDLKSPLVTIKAFLGFLEKDLFSNKVEAVKKDLGFIHSAADKMVLLLDELLKLLRVGHKKNDPVDVSLYEVVNEALMLVAGQIAARNVEVNVTQENVWIFGDRQRLVEVFQNLVDNAVKFMGDQPAPRIDIGIELVGDEVEIFVRDNGKGIDPRYQSKVFGLFEKLDASVAGAGLGLALVRRIVELHGGKIRLESDGVGLGTTFRFTLSKTQLKSRFQKVSPQRF